MQRAARRLLCALLLPLAAAVMAAACGGSDRPVVFSDLDWPSAQIQNRIAGFIVEHGYGYEVDYLPGETVALWQEMLDNDTDITIETWLPTCRSATTRALPPARSLTQAAAWPTTGRASPSPNT